MSDANIDLLDDDCLLEIFKRMSLLDQICASDVCSRWRDLCEGFCKTVYKIKGDGMYWRFNRKDGTNLFETPNMGEARSVLLRCSEYIEELSLNQSFDFMDLSEYQYFVGKIAAQCENLRSVDVREIHDDIVLTLIPIIVELNPNLTTLKIKDVHFLDLSYLVQHFPRSLTKFQILNVTPTDPNVLIELIRLSPNLKSFGCNSVQDIVAASIGSKKQLTHLYLKCAFTIAPSFNHLAELGNLVHLDLEGSIHIEDQNLVNIAHNCQQLQCLIICLCKMITDIGISSLANLEHLTDLRMRELNKVTDTSIAILPASLKELWLCGCVRVSDNGVIQFLTRATHLRLLTLKQTQITNITMEAAIRIVRDQESSRPLRILAQRTGANRRTINRTLIAELPPLLHLYF